MSTRKQVNIRLNAYIDDLLNAILNKSDMSKTDVINAGIERVAMDILGADLVDEIRLSQYDTKKRGDNC